MSKTVKLSLIDFVISPQYGLFSILWIILADWPACQGQNRKRKVWFNLIFRVICKMTYRTILWDRTLRNRSLDVCSQFELHCLVAIQILIVDTLHPLLCTNATLPSPHPPTITSTLAKITNSNFSNNTNNAAAALPFLTIVVWTKILKNVPIPKKVVYNVYQRRGSYMT